MLLLILCMVKIPAIILGEKRAELGDEAYEGGRKLL